VPDANRTLTINRPVDQVFAFFADAENDPKWRPAVKHIKRTGPLAVGTRYEQQVAGPGGRSIPADIEVTAFEPNSYVAFRVIAGPVRPQGEYRFTSSGGATEVTFTLAATLTEIKKLIMSKPVQKSMNSEMSNLDTAKRILEQAG